MMKRSGKERRENPRVDHALPIKLAVNGYDFTTSTQNISCLGAYCRIDKYMPPFTRVLVKLEIPTASKKEFKSANVECKGVVVRSEDEHSGGFNIAIFFNDIREEQKKKIAQYIKQLIPQDSTALHSSCRN